MPCPCNCHRTGAACGICCADALAESKFLEPPSAEDKSAELLKSLFKKEPQEHK